MIVPISPIALGDYFSKLPQYSFTDFIYLSRRSRIRLVLCNGDAPLEPTTSANILYKSDWADKILQPFLRDGTWNWLSKLPPE